MTPISLPISVYDCSSVWGNGHIPRFCSLCFSVSSSSVLVPRSLCSSLLLQPPTGSMPPLIASHVCKGLVNGISAKSILKDLTNFHGVNTLSNSVHFTPPTQQSWEEMRPAGLGCFPIFPAEHAQCASLEDDPPPFPHLLYFGMWASSPFSTVSEKCSLFLGQL